MIKMTIAFSEEQLQKIKAYAGSKFLKPQDFVRMTVAQYIERYPLKSTTKSSDPSGLYSNSVTEEN